jgi:type II secretory pathway pseudopilin PulG
VKHEGLRPYHAAATALRRRFAHFQARQVRREFNQVADALSNQAIDEFRSGANRQLWTLDTAEQHAAAAGLAAAEAQTHSQQPQVAQAVGGGDAGSSDGEAEGRPKTKRVRRR